MAYGYVVSGLPLVSFGALYGQLLNAPVFLEMLVAMTQEPPRPKQHPGEKPTKASAVLSAISWISLSAPALWLGEMSMSIYLIHQVRVLSVSEKATVCASVEPMHVSASVLAKHNVSLCLCPFFLSVCLSVCLSVFKMGLLLNHIMVSRW